MKHQHDSKTYRTGEPMRKLKTPFLALVLAWMLLSLTSCGDLFEFDGDAVAAVSMELDRSEVTLMQGDRLLLNALFTPDTISNDRVFWLSDDEDIVFIDNDTLVGMHTGTTQVVAISVSQRLADTCQVHVIPRWEFVKGDWPYDMAVYADVTVHGRKPDASMTIAAFCEDELRGIGIVREQFGVSYMELRVWSPYRQGDMIHFRCYDHQRSIDEEFPDSILFDGEAHGELSHLYPLTIE